MNSRNFGSDEILHVVEAISKDKGLSKELIYSIVEEALSTAATTKYGKHINTKVKIDKNSGKIQFFRELVVVKEVDETEKDNTISINDIIAQNPDIEEGSIYKEFLPPISKSRSVATYARHIITSKIKELIRDQLCKQYSSKVGEIVSGVVEKIDRHSVIIKIAHTTEALLQKEQSLNTDVFKLGDRIKAVLLKLDKDSSGPVLILSRTEKSFVAKLFFQEIPEIYDQSILIKGIAREPGSRTKIAVHSTDPFTDPIGACVGMRGMRVKQIIEELKGEKIDIVKWHSDPQTYVTNALESLEIIKINVDDKFQTINVIVSDDHLSQAIGRRGQNVRLISDLVGWKIDFLTESREREKRRNEVQSISNTFQEKLSLDDTLSELLISEGYNTIDKLAACDLEKIVHIDGIDQNIGNDIINRAKNVSLNFKY